MRVTLGERSMRQYTGGYHSLETPYRQTLAFATARSPCIGKDPFWREMVMIDGDTFFLRADYARIHFERGPDGLVHRNDLELADGARLAFDKNQIPVARNQSSQRSLST